VIKAVLHADGGIPTPGVRLRLLATPTPCGTLVNPRTAPLSEPQLLDCHYR
jgi:hypothetical protein